MEQEEEEEEGPGNTVYQDNPSDSSHVNSIMPSPQPRRDFSLSGGPSDGMSYNQSCKNDGSRPPHHPPIPFPTPPILSLSILSLSITTIIIVKEKERRLNLLKYYSISPDDV